MLPKEKKRLVFTLVALASAWLFAGCPGTLEDPDRFLDGQIPFTCPDLPGELFPKSCGGKICHEGSMAAAKLDLVSPGVVTRLVDQKGQACPGLLVDPNLPESSLLYQKLLPLPACGSPMPLGKPALTIDELQCVRDWISTQTPTGPVVEDAGAPGDAALE